MQKLQRDTTVLTCNDSKRRDRMYAHTHSGHRTLSTKDSWDHICVCDSAPWKECFYSLAVSPRVFATVFPQATTHRKHFNSKLYAGIFLDGV